MAVILGVMLVFSQWGKEEPKEETVTVPKFVGMIYKDEILNNDKYADFSIVTKEGNDPNQEPGVVLKQTPNEGMEVKKGSEITLTVNKDGEPVLVPDVTGFPQEQAEETMQEHNLVPKVVTVTDDEQAKGYVTGTNPPKRTELNPGDEVTIYVSSGPAEGISVPPVIDKSLEAAKAEIIGLTVGELIPHDDSDKKENVVIETNPLPGVKVASGTKVDITYSTGKQSTKSIDVIVNLPKNVDQDVQLKVYLDGVLKKEDTVNPSLNDLYPLNFEGSSGKQELVIKLDGQEYVAFELDFDSGKPTQIRQGEYIPPQSSEPDSSDESGWENGGTADGSGHGVGRD